MDSEDMEIIRLRLELVFLMVRKVLLEAEIHRVRTQVELLVNKGDKA